MKAVLYYGLQDIKLVDVPTPKPGPGEVLIKIGAALTCGTDFKAYRQGHPVLLKHLPSPFGHELAGIVAEVGEGVSKFKKGMRVVAANSAPCDDCFFCRRGQNQLCDNLKLHNGAYAEYNCLPAAIVKHNLHELHPDVDFATAALSEPLACALHAVEVMAVEPGETATVFGAGNMALLLTFALRQRGARVWVIGRNPKRFKEVELAGAERVTSIQDGDPVAQLRAWSDNIGPDCVFEAVGRPETWQQSVAMARKGGRVCLFGGCAKGTQVTLDAHRIHYEQIAVQGVFHYTPKQFRQAIQLLSAGKVKPELLITDRIALSDVPEFFQKTQHQSSPKVAVIP